MRGSPACSAVPARTGMILTDTLMSPLLKIPQHKSVPVTIQSPSGTGSRLPLVEASAKATIRRREGA